MNIVADKSIPYITSFFHGIGDLTLLTSSNINSQALESADLLIVRTVTRVNSQLLEGTPVKLVATPSSGHDHVDMNYLRKNGISFAHAPGCNARSVAEYVLSSLFVIADLKQIALEQKTIGIIGCGNVGSRLHSLIEALGLECLVYDPPRQEIDKSFSSSTLEEVLSADIVTLHVPLIKHGQYSTLKFVDEKFLSLLKSDVILINTSRGDVMDEIALSRFVDKNSESAIVLDVWQNEPEINIELLQKTNLATPHVAGYSLDAKFNGTRAIFKQVCEAFATGYNEPEIKSLPENEIINVNLADFDSELEAIKMAVLASYDVRTDCAALKQIQSISDDKKGEYFSDLRNNYPSRREFTSMSVFPAEGYDSFIPRLKNLGFKIMRG